MAPRYIVGTFVLCEIINVEYLQLVTHSHAGAHIPTDALRRVDHNRAREVRKWKGMSGIFAENNYPDPEGMTFEEVATDEPLSKLRLIHLTQAFIELCQTSPRGHGNCENALGGEGLPWHLVQGKKPPRPVTQGRKGCTHPPLHRSLYSRTWTDPQVK